MNPEDDDWLNKMKKFDNKEKYDKTKSKLKLKLYKNGFILDNGEFRDIKEQKNKKFMEEVEKGYIPKELEKEGYNDLGIEMEDNRDTNYEPPKEEKKFQAFTGLGKSISSVNTQGLHIDKNASSNVDKTKPTCKVNIRLFNGEVVNEDFNLNQTLQDVINFVKKKSGSNNFALLDGFPPRPLTAYNKTIQELHLEGSLLTQRIN
jgi:UBX domain-containing protein 1